MIYDKNMKITILLTLGVILFEVVNAGLSVFDENDLNGAESLCSIINLHAREECKFDYETGSVRNCQTLRIKWNNSRLVSLFASFSCV